MPFALELNKDEADTWKQILVELRKTYLDCEVKDDHSGKLSITLPKSSPAGARSSTRIEGPKIVQDHDPHSSWIQDALGAKNDHFKYAEAFLTNFGNLLKTKCADRLVGKYNMYFMTRIVKINTPQGEDHCDLGENEKGKHYFTFSFNCNLDSEENKPVFTTGFTAYPN